MAPLKVSEPRSLLSFPPLVAVLAGFFASRESTAYLVGGVVRDAVLGRPTSDVDVAVSGPVREVREHVAEFLGGRAIVLDADRDIARVTVPADNGGGFVDLTSIESTIDEDLRRRDFTIDAMAVPLGAASDASPSEIIDPLNGQADLRAGLVRAVSRKSLDADAARLIRGPRLAAQLGFEIEEQTAQWISTLAHSIRSVAPERVRDELLKLLATPSPSRFLRLLDDLDLLCEIIPELSDAKGVTQPKEHYWNVFDHLIETADRADWLLHRRFDDDGHVAELTPTFASEREYFAQEVSDGHTRSTLLKLAGLLHDIAKPATKSIEPDGRTRFFGHADLGAEMATAIMKRLRFGRRGIELVSKTIEHHLRPGQMAQKSEMPTARAEYRYYRDVGDAAIDTIYLNLADYLAARGPMLGREEWAEHCKVASHILHASFGNGTTRAPSKLIDGDDVMKFLSMPPGPNVGRYLELVSEAQASGEIESREEAIELVDTLSKGRLADA